MRSRFLFVLLVAGCTRPLVVAAPAPAPPADPPEASAPPVRVSSFHPLLFCVLRDGRLEQVEIQYVRGDSLYQGRPLFEVFLTDSTYALNSRWYRNSETIVFRGRRYVKYGLPRFLGTADVTAAGSIGPVTVFAESPDRPVLEVIYIPLQPGCEFQPYEIQGIK